MFRSLRAALALLACVLAAPCGAQSDEALERENVVVSDQQVPVAPSVADAPLAERIARILETTGWYENARVEVREGVVFLDGSAANETRKTWARELAARSEGAVAVVNRIEVNEVGDWSFEPAIREIESLVRKTIASLPLIALALVIIPLTWAMTRATSRGARWAMRGRIDSPFLRETLSRMIALPVLIIGIYFVLQVAGLTQLALSIVGGAGVIGIVIGFAFRDIAENFLASLLLSIRRPFRRGDLVTITGHTGVVQNMNTRSTILVTEDGNHVQIPNAVIFKSTIENFTAAPKRRGDFTVGIGYDVSVAAAQEVILDTLAAHEAVEAEPAPMALVAELGASTVNLRVYFWIDGTAYSPVKVRSALLRRVKRALTEAGMSMPDEAREVIFPQGVPVVHLEGAQEARASELASIALSQQAGGEAGGAEPELSEAERDLSNETAGLESEEGAIEEGATDLLEGGDARA